MRAVVIGGSLGGLNAALALRDAGCEVDVFEKSSGALEDRGAGIVVQKETIRYLEEHGIATAEEVSTPASRRRYLTRGGGVEHEESSYQRFTSWNTLYRRYKGAFPEDRYHFGSALAGFEQQRDRVTVRFAGGDEASCDLLVCADGANSTARRQLLPGTEPGYAGYVAWRGVVEARDAPALAEAFAETFTWFEMRNGHILCYPIPGREGGLAREDLRLNWVWYVNVPEGEELRRVLTDGRGEPRRSGVPPGMVRDDLVRRMKGEAGRLLPDVFRHLVEETEEPFVQAIQDLSVPRMAFGRVCLLGEAAFVPRPHTAASASKAAANANALGRCVRKHGKDVAAALEEWEPEQLKLGSYLDRLGRSLGDRSQFGR